jgi:plastocyanin
MKIVRPAALGALLLALCIAAIACGDDDDDGDTNGAADEPLPTATRGTTASPTTGSESTPSGEATAAGGNGGETVAVTAADFSFNPADFTVSGDSDTTIEVTNSGNTPHTLTIYSDAEFTEAVDGATTDSLSSGDSESFTLTAAQVAGAASLFFRCEVHPTQMQGEITVQ